MADSYYDDQDPRATIPIVSGSNFAQSAIGRTAAAPATTAPAPTARRSRWRVFAAAGWVAVVLIVAAAAAWISYLVTGPR